MRSCLRLCAGAAALLLAAGCAAVPVRPARELPEPAAIQRQLIQDEDEPRRLRGLASLRFEGPAGSGSATQAVVLGLPDRARLETLGPLGTAALVVVLRGDELRVHWLLEDAFGVGRATAETLGRLTRVPLPPSLVLRLLAGLPPLPISPRDPRLRVTARADTVRVESVAGPWWQRFWTTRAGVTAEAGEVGDAAGPVLRFRFGDHRAVDQTTFPFSIHLEIVPAGSRLQLAYTSVRLGGPLESDLFELPLPAGGHTRLLDLGQPAPGIPGGEGTPQAAP
jgi:hypothetical protein